MRFLPLVFLLLVSSCGSEGPSEGDSLAGQTCEEIVAGIESDSWSHALVSSMESDRIPKSLKRNGVIAVCTLESSIGDGPLVDGEILVFSTGEEASAQFAKKKAGYPDAPTVELGDEAFHSIKQLNIFYWRDGSRVLQLTSLDSGVSLGEAARTLSRSGN